MICMRNICVRLVVIRFFTQSDPRSVDDGEILLFQLNSVKDIMWGDAGVANFFIDREALKNRDFSHVMYNWDCY